MSSYKAQTILTAIDDTCTSDDLARPGHVFPIRARRGGVLVRAGQTEGSVDLARLAGMKPAGVICEIMNEDGTMARMPELRVEPSQSYEISLQNQMDARDSRDLTVTSRRSTT